MSGSKPLFLVGMPRSGTKLLRTILNNHPSIGIATSETEFLPNWIKEWPSYGELSERGNFHKFYKRSMRFPYFQNQQRKGTVIDEEAWFKSCTTFDLPAVFSQVIQQNIGFKQNLLFWGDKSPGYTFWIKEINDAFPNAKFVHIVRDPRDYALSVQKAWGRNLSRAVQLWKDGTRYVDRVSQSPGVHLYTLKFEDLLQDPDATITKLCGFLGVPFFPEMLTVGRVESVGDAAEKSGIVKANMNKFAEKLTPTEIRKMESVCGKAMQRFDYHPIYEASDRDLPTWKMLSIRVLDSFNVVRSNAKRRGWFYGLKHAILFRLMRMGAHKNRKDLVN